MKKTLWQIVLFLVAISLVGLWQSRSIPSGQAPQELLLQLKSMQAAHVPAIGQSNSDVQLLYFFAPWCSVCRMSGPNALAVERFFGGVTVKFIALDFDCIAEVTEFSDQVGLGQNVFLGTDTTKATWRVSAYPTYVIVGRDGFIHSASVGYSTMAGMMLRILWVKLIG